MLLEGRLLLPICSLNFDHHWWLQPERVCFLVHPVFALFVKFKFEIPEQMAQSKSHLVVCQAVGLVSFLYRNAEDNKGGRVKSPMITGAIGLLSSEACSRAYRKWIKGRLVVILKLNGTFW